MRSYYKLPFFIISVVLFLVLSTFTSLAQTSNNPNDDLNANACYEWGTLYDTCDHMDVDYDFDIDQQDMDWMWTCGYYLIRVEYGIYSEDVLDGICLEIIEIVVVEKEEKKKKKKCVLKCAD